jgi:hypothetical protein
MNTAEVHTIEHLAATFLRNEPNWKEKVIYFGPMGCRTGFYLLMAGELESRDVLPLVRDCFRFVADFSGEVPILRKGAIRALEGEQVIIPINMRDGIILGIGKGNEDWNCSAPHGSGRIYRRSEVKEHHTVAEFKESMQGIHSICVNKDTLDESPFAYRKIQDIMEVIGDTVEIQKVIKPIYNFKAAE